MRHGARWVSGVRDVGEVGVESVREKRAGFFFFTLVTGPRRSLSLKLSDTSVYAPQIRARLGTASNFCRGSGVRDVGEVGDEAVREKRACPRRFDHSLFLITSPYMAHCLCCSRLSLSLPLSHTHRVSGVRDVGEVGDEAVREEGTSQKCAAVPRRARI